MIHDDLWYVCYRKPNARKWQTAREGKARAFHGAMRAHVIATHLRLAGYEVCIWSDPEGTDEIILPPLDWDGHGRHDPITAYYKAMEIAKHGRHALVFAPDPDNTLLYSLGPADVVDTLSTTPPPAAPAAPTNTSESEP